MSAPLLPRMSAWSPRRVRARVREGVREQAVDPIVGAGEQVPVDAEGGRHRGVPEFVGDLDDSYAAFRLAALADAVGRRPGSGEVPLSHGREWEFLKLCTPKV